jgi:hypothetical protein
MSCARVRFATFAHAMRRTRPVVARRISSVGLAPLVISSITGRVSTVRLPPTNAWGCSAATRREIVSRSAPAAFPETPAFRRP